MNRRQQVEQAIRRPAEHIELTDQETRLLAKHGFTYQQYIQSVCALFTVIDDPGEAKALAELTNKLEPIRMANVKSAQASRILHFVDA